LVRHFILSAVLAITLAAAPTASRSDQAELHPVQQDIKKLTQAVFSGDVETILGFTHPTVVAMLGGRDAARATLQQSSDQFVNGGVALESLTFPGPPDFIAVEDRRFAIVPILTIMSIDGQRIEIFSFQIGVREPGATDWTYVDGIRINGQNVGTLFPDFPSDYDFPEVHTKLL